MANTTTTPNMSLPNPVPGVDPGPDWALNISACFSILDSHNHSQGQGNQITPSGINLNSDLPFNQNNLTTARSLRLFPNLSVLTNPADIGCLFEAGVDLYYTDGGGNIIRITQSGGVAGTPGSISGLVSPASASFVSANATFVWQSAVSTPANMDIASVTLRNLTANSKGLTLNPPNSMGSNYSITLPVLPAASGVVLIASDGTMTTTPASAFGTYVRSINAQTGVSYTFVLTDGTAGSIEPMVTFSNASAITATVPANADVAFPIGTQIDMIQTGAGQLTIAPFAGVTVNSAGGFLSTVSRYIGLTLIKVGTDSWVLLGATV